MGRRQTACTTRSVGAVYNRTIIESFLKNQMKFLYLKQELIDNTANSVARGNFGSPSFFVNEELFFGKDKLRDLEEEIVSKLG